MDDTTRAGLPSHNLQIVRTRDGEAVVVRVSGEVDLATAPLLDEQLHDLEESAATCLILDLGGVEFMDSTGLNSIIRAVRNADSNGHQLAFRPGSPQVQRLFELTGVLESLTFVD